MKPTFSFYNSGDLGRVYHFLRDVGASDYIAYDRVRFQFCLALHPHLVGATKGFERTCGLWQDKSGIVSLAFTEGGTFFKETFFVFRSQEDKTSELLSRMCDFAERFTSYVSDDEKSNSGKLCIAQDDKILSDFVLKRGYTKTEERERTMVKEYPQMPDKVVLPDGFIIKDARDVTPFYSALAHNVSFRGNQKDDGCEKGFAAIRNMPDYRPDLDLILFDSEGQPAGLANFWISEKSKTASLEPLGVAWWYRRMGLGKALITEGINRTRAYGCDSLVGGDQKFYWDLGFESKKEYYLWEWTSK